MPPILLPPCTTTELDNGDSSSSRLSLPLRYLTVSSDSSDHSPSTLPPDPSDFSFSLSSSDMCYADELFGHGMLLPYKPRCPPPSPSTAETSNNHMAKPLLFPHRHSASLDRAALCRAKNLRRRRAASDSDQLTTAPPKPRWYKAFVLGPAKFPGTVEMREIRSRQRRRRASPLPTPAPQESASLPWKLLQSLSCKSAGVGIIAPVSSPCELLQSLGYRGMESPTAVSAAAPPPSPAVSNSHARD